MLNWILDRAAESSTWAGLAGVAGSVGVSDTTYHAVASVIMAICGLIAVIMKEKSVAKAPPQV